VSALRALLRSALQIHIPSLPSWCLRYTGGRVGAFADRADFADFADRAEFEKE